jgi:hypothetical protein
MEMGHSDVLDTAPPVFCKKRLDSFQNKRVSIFQILQEPASHRKQAAYLYFTIASWNAVVRAVHKVAETEREDEGTRRDV